MMTKWRKWPNVHAMPGGCVLEWTRQRSSQSAVEETVGKDCSTRDIMRLNETLAN